MMYLYTIHNYIQYQLSIVKLKGKTFRLIDVEMLHNLFLLELGMCASLLDENEQTPLWMQINAILKMLKVQDIRIFDCYSGGLHLTAMTMPNTFYKVVNVMLKVERLVHINFISKGREEGLQEAA